MEKKRGTVKPQYSKSISEGARGEVIMKLLLAVSSPHRDIDSLSDNERLDLSSKMSLLKKHIAFIAHRPSRSPPLVSSVPPTISEGTETTDGSDVGVVERGTRESYVRRSGSSDSGYGSTSSNDRRTCSPSNPPPLVSSVCGCVPETILEESDKFSHQSDCGQYNDCCLVTAESDEISSERDGSGKRYSYDDLVEENVFAKSFDKENRKQSHMKQRATTMDSCAQQVILAGNEVCSNLLNSTRDFSPVDPQSSPELVGTYRMQNDIKPSVSHDNHMLDCTIPENLTESELGLAETDEELLYLSELKRKYEAEFDGNMEFKEIMRSLGRPPSVSDYMYFKIKLIKDKYGRDYETPISHAMSVLMDDSEKSGGVSYAVFSSAVEPLVRNARNTTDLPFLLGVLGGHVMEALPQFGDAVLSFSRDLVGERMAGGVAKFVGASVLPNEGCDSPDMDDIIDVLTGEVPGENVAGYQEKGHHITIVKPMTEEDPSGAPYEVPQQPRKSSSDSTVSQTLLHYSIPVITMATQLISTFGQLN